MKRILILVTLAALLAVTFSGCTAAPAANAQPAKAPVADTEEANASTAGDASKKAILVVSFGTSYNDTREKTIGAIEKQIAEHFPDYEVRRAFTSQTIIDKLQKRDGLVIDNIQQAMEHLIADGIGNVIVQPTHVMNGYEYDEMKAAIEPYEDKFAVIKYGMPLLSSVEDYREVVAAFASDISELPKDDAVVFMGHGTKHFANATYSALDYMFKDSGYANMFVGTVESYPSLGTVMKKVEEYGAKKVTLVPLMIVAGDHATNDMAGDEEGSWKTQFKKKGYEVECVLEGMGEYQTIRDIFLRHVDEAINSKEK